MTDETVVMVASLRHRFGLAITMAMSNGSGGIGKKELSAKDSAASARSACFFSLQLMTQL